MRPGAPIVAPIGWHRNPLLLALLSSLYLFWGRRGGGKVITDLSYGFELLNDYTAIIHERVRRSPR